VLQTHEFLQTLGRDLHKRISKLDWRYSPHDTFQEIKITHLCIWEVFFLDFGMTFMGSPF